MGGRCAGAALVAVLAVGCGSMGASEDGSSGEVVTDWWHDPWLEPGDDMVCEPGTPGGTCSMVDQCGCGRQWCKLVAIPEGCEVVESCVASPGTRDVGMSCDHPVSGFRRCMPGLLCHIEEGETSGVCLHACRIDEDCPMPESTCTTEVVYHVPEGDETFPDCGGIPIAMPYMACTMEVYP